MKTVTIQIPDHWDVCPNCQSPYDPTQFSHAPWANNICQIVSVHNRSGERGWSQTRRDLPA